MRLAGAQPHSETARSVLGDVLGERARGRAGSEDAGDRLVLKRAVRAGVTERLVEVGTAVSLTQEQDLARLVGGKTRDGDGQAVEE